MKPISLQPEHVALIIVTYRNVKDTLRCLESVYGMNCQPKHIILVENGSDPSIAREMIRAWQELAARMNKEKPEMTYTEDMPTSAGGMLRVDQNNGYACGCNAGLRVAVKQESVAAFWLLNNDTLVAPDALEVLCNRLNLRPDAGTATSLLVDINDRETLLCAGGGSFSLQTGVTREIGQGMNIHSAMACPVTLFESKMDYACGASLLLRRSNLETVGFMEERYYLYYEDVEYSLRSKRNGILFTVANRSVVYHKAGATTALEPCIDFYAVRNRLDCVRQYAFWALLLTLLHIFCGIGKVLLYRKPMLALFRLKGVWAFFRGRWGRGDGCHAARPLNMT